MFAWLKSLLCRQRDPPSQKPRQFLHIPLQVRPPMPIHLRARKGMTAADYQAYVGELQEQADRGYPVPVRIELLVHGEDRLPVGGFVATLPEEVPDG